MKKEEIKKSHKLPETNGNTPESWPDRKSVTSVSEMIALPAVGGKKKVTDRDFSHVVHF